jgi:hypothetical protein
MQAKISQIRRSGGKIHIRFGKESFEFDSLADVKAFARDFDRDDLKRMLVVAALKRQPQLLDANLSTLDNLTINIDLSLANCGVIS